MITIIIRWLAWSLNCVQASTIPELTRCQPPKEDRGPYSINSITGTKLNQVGYVVMKNWSWQRRQKTAIGKLSGKTLSELTYRQKSRRNQSINWLKSLNWINFINQTKQPVEIVDFLKRWISFLQKLQGRGYTRHPLASSRTVRDDNWVKTTSDWIEFLKLFWKRRKYLKMSRLHQTDWSYHVDSLNMSDENDYYLISVNVCKPHQFNIKK